MPLPQERRSYSSSDRERFITRRSGSRRKHLEINLLDHHDFPGTARAVPSLRETQCEASTRRNGSSPRKNRSKDSDANRADFCGWTRVDFDSSEIGSHMRQTEASHPMPMYDAHCDFLITRNKCRDLVDEWRSAYLICSCSCDDSRTSTYLAFRLSSWRRE